MKQNTLILLVSLGIMAGCATKPKTDATSTTSTGSAVVPVNPPKTAATTATAPAATTTQAKATSIDIFVCKRDSDVREVYIEPVTPLGCKLWYSNDKSGPVASSVRGLSHCEAVNQKIRTNLEAAGFKCDAVANATASK